MRLGLILWASTGPLVLVLMAVSALRQSCKNRRDDEETGMAKIEVTADEVQEQIDKSYGTDEEMMSGESRWPGMTYEQGVQNALNWVLGNADMGPMDEE